MKTMEFNINNKVKVRLTDVGREIRRKKFERDRLDFESTCKRPYPLEFSEKAEDEHGWSEWQMWELFQEFGADIGMGLPPPFETTIQLYIPE